MRLRFLILLLVMTMLPIAGYAQSVEPGQGIIDIAWSPDATQLVTADPGGAVRIWDQSVRLLQTFSGHENRVTAVAQNPDGSLIASGGRDSFVRIWDIKTGRLIHEFKPFLEGGIVALAWQPSGKYLLVAGFNSLQAWDTSTWVALLDNIGISVWDVKWHPDGSKFAYINGTRIRVGTIENSQFTVVAPAFKEVQEVLLAIDWSLDGKKLLTAGGRGGTVRLWDAVTGTQIRILLQTDEIVTNAIFTREDGTQVAAITDEGNLYILDALTGDIEQKLTRNARLWDMDWNPTANFLAISGLNKSALSIDQATPDAPRSEEEIMATGFLEIISLGESK
jgi:WD40 repeat protein